MYIDPCRPITSYERCKLYEDFRELQEWRAQMLTRKADMKIEDLSCVVGRMASENSRLKQQKKKLEEEIQDLEVDLRKLQCATREAYLNEKSCLKETEDLSVEREALCENNRQLAQENRVLQARIQALQRVPPVITLQSPCCERIEWRVFGICSKVQSTPVNSCLSSPIFRCPRLGIDRLEFDFYPTGACGAPPRGCSLVVRGTRGMRLTFQLFVGGKRSDHLVYTFSGWAAGGYRQDFPRVRDEIDGSDNSILVGIDIFSSTKNGKTIFV